MSLKKEQEELFYQLRKLIPYVDILSSPIQNDLERMLSDGMITKDEIKRNIQDVDMKFLDYRNKVENLRHKTIKFLEKVLEIETI
jgi:hypothetical protein